MTVIAVGHWLAYGTFKWIWDRYSRGMSGKEKVRKLAGGSAVTARFESWAVSR
jgi:hypothetical protein